MRIADLSLSRGLRGLAFVAVTAGPVDAASCGAYLGTVRPLVTGHVETLRTLERETADRRLGLDTRTYPFLAGEVRKAAAAIGDAAALAEEGALKSCPDEGPPVRRVCASAAQALAQVIDALELRAPIKTPQDAYTDAMPRCEGWMNLRPLSTTLRTAR